VPAKGRKNVNGFVTAIYFGQHNTLISDSKSRD